MAIIQGISGAFMEDGNGGKIALDIQKGILRILAHSGISYMTATIGDRRQVQAGSVSYQVPEIMQAEDYGDGTTDFQNIRSGIIDIQINTRRTVKYAYEQFDYARLGFFEGVIGVISNSVAKTIQNDLNAHFWSTLVSKFELTTGELRTQNLTLPEILPDLDDISNYTIPDADDVRAAIAKIQLLTTKLSKTFDMKILGLDKAEFMVFLAPEADANIRSAYWNQPNSLGERVIADNLVGYKLGGGIYYYLDPMLNNKITAGTSFSKDKDLDTSGFIGFIVHNEAVAMPFNLNTVIPTINPTTGNPQFICKYQFGIGFLRTNLVYSITKTAPTT